MDISILPDELFHLIFAHLTISTLLKVPLVCRAWRTLCASADGPVVRVHNAFHLLLPIRIECAPLYLAAMAARFAGIVEINLDNVVRRDEILLLLRMSSHRGHLARLAVLNLTSQATTGRMTDTCLLHVAAHVHLTTLVLNGCARITNNGIRAISGMSRLRSLSIANCRRVSDAGLKDVARLLQLRSLDASGTDISDTGLQHICGLAFLTVLSIASCRRVTDTGLRSVGNLRRLTCLDLTNVQAVTDAGLGHITGLAQLTSLKLALCRAITHTGLAHVATLTLLRSVDLAKIGNISDTGLAHIATLGALAELSLCFDSVTRAGLGHVQHVAMVDRSFCKVTA